jgi:hypothetical protein
MRKKKWKNYIVLGDNGELCPRCNKPTQIREHEKITQQHLAQPFYYSRWFFCTNADCKTTLIMPEDKKVFKEPKERDKSYAAQLIEAQLEYAITGKVEDEFADNIDIGEKPPWD